MPNKEECQCEPCVELREKKEANNIINESDDPKDCPKGVIPTEEEFCNDDEQDEEDEEECCNDDCEQEDENIIHRSITLVTTDGKEVVVSYFADEDDSINGCSECGSITNFIRETIQGNGMLEVGESGLICGDMKFGNVEINELDCQKVIGIRYE